MFPTEIPVYTGAPPTPIQQDQSVDLSCMISHRQYLSHRYVKKWIITFIHYWVHRHVHRIRRRRTRSVLYYITLKNMAQQLFLFYRFFLYLWRTGLQNFPAIDIESCSHSEKRERECHRCSIWTRTARYFRYNLVPFTTTTKKSKTKSQKKTLFSFRISSVTTNSFIFFSSIEIAHAWFPLRTESIAYY